MPRKIDNRRDILLLLLYSPGVTDKFNEPIVGRTRLVKMIFLFKKEALKHFRVGTSITEENFYEFFAWDYGPFSRQVYDDLMFFNLRGFISVRDTAEEAIPESAREWNYWATQDDSDAQSTLVIDYQEESFELQERGVIFCEELYQSLNDDQKTLLKEFKKRMSSTPLRAILEYVYKKYDDQTTKSKIKDRIIGTA